MRPHQYLIEQLKHCATSGRGSKGHVYAVKHQYLPGMVKIGYARDVRERLKNLSCAMPIDFELVDSAYVHHAADVEVALHSCFSDERVSPNREFFMLKDELVVLAFDIVREIEGVDMAKVMAAIMPKEAA
jgi:hypothetical protein